MGSSDTCTVLENYLFLFQNKVSLHPQGHIDRYNQSYLLLSKHLLNHFFKQVICVHDVSSIYRVPLLLEEQGVVDYFLRRLDLPVERQSRKMLMKWKEMADRSASSYAVGVHAVIFCEAPPCCKNVLALLRVKVLIEERLRG